jgi:hypothetical protein
MLRPVNRLPLEILSRIVRCVPREHDTDTRSIIPLTHVCRYWREFIIFTPEHWTTISSRSRGLAAVSLERAKPAPLEITLSTPLAREGRWFSDLLKPHLQNTEILKVHYLSAIELKDILPNFPQSMPNLRSLALVARQGPGWDQFIDPFETFPPSMRYLKLVDIPLYPSLLKHRTLTELDLRDRQFNLHLDTLLDFLEENRSLKSAILILTFKEPSLRSSRRRTPIRNRLQYLRITCSNAMDGQVLISSIALSKGAELAFFCYPSSGISPTVDDVLSGISTTHLSNLQSPTFMEYRVYEPRTIQLLGPNGTAKFSSPFGSGIPFAEFPRLPLTDIRRLHLDTCRGESILPPPGLALFHHLPSFPALETLTIECYTDLSCLLSPLFSNPSSPPSLKTLAFLDCTTTEEFMKELTRFASDRKSTTSVVLHRVVIFHREGKFPSTASIRELEDYVPVVDVRIATRMPIDLT